MTYQAPSLRRPYRERRYTRPMYPQPRVKPPPRFQIGELSMLKYRTYCPPRLHMSVEGRHGRWEWALLYAAAWPALAMWVVAWHLLAVICPHAEKPPVKRREYFAWTRYRLLWFAFAIYAHLRLPDPVEYDPAVFPKWARRRLPFLGEPALAPEPSRLGWHPGIAFMPTTPYPTDSFATLAETTTTSDPGTSGTSLAVATRSPFPQETWRRFYVLVQDSETSKTNREIMLVTAGMGTGAGSFTVTRGQEGTTGVAHASGSYVAQVVTATGLRNALLQATGFINANSQHGAKGDESGDERAALQNAINAAYATLFMSDTLRAGIVLIGPGSYWIDEIGGGDIRGLVFPTDQQFEGAYSTDITILGAGWRATSLRRGGTDPIVMDASGTITAGNVVTRRTGLQIRDIGFNGFNTVNNGTEPLLRSFYVTQFLVERCYFRSSGGGAFRGVEYQDSQFTGCWFDDTAGNTTASNIGGTNVGQESIRLLSKDDNATTGTFGYSTDNSNNVWFVNNWSTGLDSKGQIVVSKNGGSNDSHRIYFTHHKIEQDPGDSNASLVKLWNCQSIRFMNVDYSGYTAGLNPVTWIEADTAKYISIRNVFFDDASTASVTHAALKLTACTYWTIEDAIFNIGAAAGGDSTAAVVAEFVGTANDQFYIQNYTVIGTRQTPLYSGTLPVNFFAPARFYNMRKTADQLLAGVGVQNITDLSFASAANTDWTFQATIFTNNTASDVGGAKFAISAPTGSTIKAQVFGPAASATAFTSALITAISTLTGVAFGTVAATPAWVTISGTIRVGSTAGTVQLQAAEGTAGDDITIQANSNLWAQKI